MDSNNWVLGILKIQRAAGAADPYIIEELGGVQISGTDEEDLVPHYDGSWEAVTNLVDNCTAAKLCQDIQAGTIVVTERTKPRLRGPLDG